MTSRTRSKFEEAQYFLNCVQDLCKKQNAPYLREIPFHLSAFIGAARSITWVMKHEYDAVPGWQQWYDAKGADASESELLDRFNSLRIESVKKGALQPHFVPLILPILSTVPGERPRATHAVLRAGPGPEQPLIVEGAELQWVIDVDKQEVLFSSANYLNLLGKLVEECEASFGVPNE